MDILNALLLGIVEGVTEFLPISSTGHLILFNQWLNLRPGLAETFDVFIQLGAILAVIWLYRTRLLDLLRRLPSDRSAQRLALTLALAFVPAGLLGFLFHSRIKDLLYKPVPVALALILGGVAIWLLDREQGAARIKGLEAVPPMTGLGIGVAQALALVPGVSRSAASILGGLGLGLDRRTAVEFSFFLSIPTMLIATLYDLLKSASGLGGSDWLVLAVGFVSAFVTALVVIQMFLRYITTHTFRPFAVYRVALGLLVLVLFAVGVLR